MSYIWTILITLAVCYIGLILFALFFANKLIFPAQPATYGKDDSHIKLKTAQGEEVVAIHLPHQDAKYTILYSHGNAEDLGDIRPHLERLQALGFSIFAHDYPGYGLSSGTPSEEGCYGSINAAYAYLKEQLKVSPENIILYGRSLGGGPSVDLASRELIAGVILRGTFSSTFRVMTKRKLVPWDVFDNIAKIHKIDAPLLIVHGDQDRTVPYSHGVALYKKAKEPKTLVTIEGAGHNNAVDLAGPKYWNAIHSFGQSLK